MKRTLEQQLKERRLLLELTQQRLRRRKLRKPLPQLQPDAIRLAYYQELKQVLQRARELVHAQVLPALADLVRQADRERGDAAQRTDSAGTRVNALLDGVANTLFQELTGPVLQRLADKYARRTSDFQRKELQKQIRSVLGVDLALVERNLSTRVEDFTAEQVARIKSMAQGYLDDVEKRVIAGVRAGTRPSEIAQGLVDRYGVAESSAQRIANDQVGKFYGELNRVRQTDLGVNRYVWNTVRDNRVREEHAQRHGETYAWDEPPEDGHPGEAINCRCFAEPDLSQLLELAGVAA